MTPATASTTGHVFRRVQQLDGGDLARTVHTLLTLYGFAAIIGVIAFGGLIGRRPGRWCAALLAASAAWALGLVVIERSVDGTATLLIGYWIAELGIALALIGALVAFAGMRSEAPPVAIPLAQDGVGLNPQPS